MFYHLGLRIAVYARGRLPCWPVLPEHPLQTWMWTDRLIKPSFRDSSLKPTEQIKDKDGERQTDTGWELCEGCNKAIDH